MSHAEADDKFAQTVNNMFGANISGSAESNERVEVTVLANAEGGALGEWGDQRLERGHAEGLGSSLADPPIVRGRGRVHCMQRAILSVHAV